jgi:iron complex transport system substrate-binding protein
LLLLCFLLQPVHGADSKRVITLAPHLTELVFAVAAEDRLAGVVDYSDHPPAALDLPRIGDAFRFDYERILSLEADLALAWRGGTPAVVGERLEDLGVELLWVETRRLEDIPAALRQLGHTLDSQPAAERAAADFEAQLAALRADLDPAASILEVFYQVSARPLYTLGGRHILNEVLALCGMRNVFEALDVEAAVVDREAVIAADPDLILAAPGAQDPFAGGRQLDDVPRLDVDPDRLIRPTPRLVDGARDLCRRARPGMGPR